MKFVKNIISRVRWNVVLSIVAVIIFILIGFLVVKPFSGNTNCTNGVCISSWADPGEIPLRGEGSINVKVTNRGSEDLTVTLGLETRNPVLYFKETGKQKKEERIELGSGESMTLDFGLRANATYPGNYRVDVTASYNDKEVTQDVYLSVKEIKTSSF